jgi:hypothetical protein
MIDGRGQSCGDTSVTDLTNTPRPEFVEHRIAIVEKGDIDIRSIGMGRNDVVRQVAVDRSQVVFSNRAIRECTTKTANQMDDHRTLRVAAVLVFPNCRRMTRGKQ